MRLRKLMAIVPDGAAVEVRYKNKVYTNADDLKGKEVKLAAVKTEGE